MFHFVFVEATGKTTADPEAGTNLTVSNWPKVFCKDMPLPCSGRGQLLAVNSLRQQHVNMQELHQLPPLKSIVLEVYCILDNKLELQLQQHDYLPFFFFVIITKYQELNTEYKDSEVKKKLPYLSFQPAWISHNKDIFSTVCGHSLSLHNRRWKWRTLQRNNIKDCFKIHFYNFLMNNVLVFFHFFLISTKK